LNANKFVLETRFKDDHKNWNTNFIIDMLKKEENLKQMVSVCNPDVTQFFRLKLKNISQGTGLPMDKINLI